MESKFSWHIILIRLSGLLRSRSILSVFAIIMMAKAPSAAVPMAIALGMAMGVSAIDAFREMKNPVDLVKEIEREVPK